MTRFYLRIWFTVFVTGLIGIFLGFATTRFFVDVPGIIDQKFLALIASDSAIQSGDSKLEQDKIDALFNQFDVSVRIVLPNGEPHIFAARDVNASLRGQSPEKELNLKGGRRLQLLKTAVTSPGLQLVLFVVLSTALGIAAATYIVVRKLTYRIERLKQTVERVGRGELSARVIIEGNDEIAALARSFNDSSQKIQDLLRANQQLLANASHELRSPLARVRIAAELLSEKSQQTQSTAMQEIRLSIQELDHLIDEILTGASLQQVGINEADALCNASAILSTECQRLGIEYTQSKMNYSLKMPAKLFSRMVRNLLENAKKYGSQKKVTVFIKQIDATVLIHVCDLGIGVPEQDVERIFEPFFRRKGASEISGGVGLGLSLARQIARQYGGDIVCSPNQPCGSVFEISIPLERTAKAVKSATESIG